MGHIRNGQGVYGRLQKRLDRFPIGAPPAAALYEILKRLFTEEEARVGCRMPMGFAGLEEIARRAKRNPDALRPILEGMADKGLVMDFDRKGKAVYMLSPTLLGFFEFAFMRVRDDIPQKELARFMVEYVHYDEDFARAVFAGRTQAGRTLVHESSIDPEDAAHVLDYERATQVVKDAKAWAVSLCYCRHVMEHEGKACAKPLEVCTTLNAAADFLVRRRLARKISREEALDIFAATREAGLARRRQRSKAPGLRLPLLRLLLRDALAINRFRIFDAVVTSPFLPAVDTGKCTGCGLCAKRCPIRAIEVQGMGKEGKAVVDGKACLGCGVCKPACAGGALRMERRKERILVPENAWERAVTMAIERGKFQNFLFDDFDRPDHAALRVITRIVVGLPPVKKALLSRQFKSRFFKALGGA
jgi:Pyruvate/2-oxoacid:ferredoxin oxidoreductase delta subunit